MGKFTFNNDGSIDYKKGVLQSIFGGGNAEQLQAHQYNQALKQYNEQFQFQKDQFSFNKDVANFNMNLANRQQAMQEEAYYNGVSNQAKQLASLGINPASQGQALSSGPSMSGGSNVSGASAGSTSASAGFDAFGSSKVGLEMLSLLASLKKMKTDEKIALKNADIAQQQANTADYNAKTSRITAESGVAVDKSTIAVNDRKIESSLIQDSYTVAQTLHINSQSEYQQMLNRDYSETNDRLKAFKINQNDIRMLEGIDYKTAIALGVYAIFGNAGKGSNWDSNQVPITEAEWEQVMENAQSYSSLAPRQKDVVDRFFVEFGIDSSLGKDFPASNLVEWRRSGYQDYQIYDALMKYYGVEGVNPYNTSSRPKSKSKGKYNEVHF